MEKNHVLETYPGSRQFEPLAKYTGLPLDQMNFVLCQLAGLLAALLFRRYLRPSAAGAPARHLVAATVGCVLLFFCYGWDTLHVVALASLAGAVIRLVPAHSVHKVCLVVALGYLSIVHLIRMNNQKAAIHISGSVMVLTMKVTLLACSIHDGSVADDGSADDNGDLKPELRRLAVRKLPSLVEYVGFVFNFQTVFAGPMIDFRTYVNFIEQEPTPVLVPKQSGQPDRPARLVAPSPTTAVLTKLASGAVFVFCVAVLLPRFSVSFITEPEFASWRWWRRAGYVWLACVLVRCRYYAVWTLADVNCNASGLGFSGVTEDGAQRWDGVTNIVVSKVEWGENFREVLENWNIGTYRWLRLVAYERTTRHRTLAVYALSAFWHGFNPAYYVTFSIGALLTQAGRMARRCLRSRVVRYFPALHPLYDLAGRAATVAALVYFGVAFALLDVRAAVTALSGFYISFTSACVFLIVVLPRLLPPLRPPPPPPVVTASPAPMPVDPVRCAADLADLHADLPADLPVGNGHCAAPAPNGLVFGRKRAPTAAAGGGVPPDGEVASSVDEHRRRVRSPGGLTRQL